MTHSTDGAADGDFGSDESIEATASKETSFEGQVNAAVKEMTQNEEGVWVVPEGLSEEVAYATTLEKRRRDTQSSYAKTSHELEATKERAGKLESKLKDAFKPELTAEQQDELDELKESDPEAYRQKMNEYEAAASEAFEEELADMGYDAEEVNEMATRATQLTDFLADNPGLKLDDDVFENDLPPRITGKLEKGEITFPEFLKEAGEFLTKGTKFANEDEGEDDEPNLSKAGGGSEASKAAVDKDTESSYKNEIY